jgi:hypothetical protein
VVCTALLTELCLHDLRLAPRTTGAVFLLAGEGGHLPRRGAWGRAWLQAQIAYLPPPDLRSWLSSLGRMTGQRLPAASALPCGWCIVAAMTVDINRVFQRFAEAPEDTPDEELLTPEEWEAIYQFALGSCPPRITEEPAPPRDGSGRPGRGRRMGPCS